MSREGGCFCGKVRYRVSGEPRHVVHCHCTMCRRTSGAAFVTWASFAAGDFEWTRGEAGRLASSARAERRFCGDCGSALTFRHADYPDDIDVTAASLDGAEDLAPTRHIWTSTRLPWIHLDDGLPQYRERSPEG